MLMWMWIWRVDVDSLVLLLISGIVRDLFLQLSILRAGEPYLHDYRDIVLSKTDDEA
jgi:hypothetical protein